MPSPIGHALAGVAAAWAADLIPGDRAWRTAPESASVYKRAGNGLTLACGALAAAPDLDLLTGTHRTVTHSLGAIVCVGLVAAALAANAGKPITRVALMCAAAYGTHLLLDWLGADNYPPRGIQAFWPFSLEWFISDIDLFPQTARQQLWTSASLLKNLRAVVQEIAILGPTVFALWLVRVKALARLAPEVSSRHYPAQ
jgi:inner membrane protein